jgi:hypothetical protein
MQQQTKECSTGLSTNKNVGYKSNEEYVARNPSRCFVDDPDKTYEYAKLLHPLRGMTFEKKKPMKYFKTCSILDASKYADVVTVCCYEKLGTITIQHIKAPLKEARVNISSIGNIAYIATHHSNKDIRARAAILFNLFQAKAE